ncbi:tRNA uridine-5-carboxymethylaminomethyl(34) synthesis GTPase MnmE [Candidatus Pelagibacter communis]|uniref:tRNA uridine-5-carboxymethylaminomethyl(34) synthesis GTPase MnmE n=1 Tax=Pelagibacter ubique TaxID=198252 RepID=UPI00094C114D|nr:tRNA uridine-5-carboxymethylaminomethyl(34) synthesis GTPase MnmE [Candidatus Pelagibacter ubique]
MTIYALSSGPGVSGVAVIRISGSETSKVIKSLTGKQIPQPRVATLRKINNINTSELIDEGIILWFPGPESYTGEDMAEIHVHGGKAVVLAVQNEISKIKNCRLAEPGEFTKLAFQNGKINLLKAESIADLITAETEIQRLQAIKIMKGKSSERFNELRDKLLKILSYVEAKIDFPDEDLPEDNIKKIKENSLEVLNDINKILNDQKVGEIIREGFKIAIVGPTNAGKSSLINYLSNREVAIVSEIAGTTRDVVETHLNIDGYPVIISDTAGIRDSKDEIEKKGIKLSLKKAENADLKLVVVDAKSIDFSGFFNDLIKKNAILVINKSDLLNKKLDQEISKHNHVLISLKDNLNIDELITKIKNNIRDKFITEEDILITRERHRQHLVQCADHLKNFLDKNNKKDFDKAAEDLRLATRHLGMIVGKVDVEEILGSIFNDFCIGK